MEGVAIEHRFEGYVDGIKDGWVMGWAWTPSRPSEPIQVDIVVDGVRTNGCKADRYRYDLERGGKGDGHRGFEVRLPEEVKEVRSNGCHSIHRNAPHSFSLYTRDPKREAFHLSNSFPRKATF
jgi:hypothetical protein